MAWCKTCMPQAFCLLLVFVLWVVPILLEGREDKSGPKLSLSNLYVKIGLLDLLWGTSFHRSGGARLFLPLLIVSIQSAGLKYVQTYSESNQYNASFLSSSETNF